MKIPVSLFLLITTHWVFGQSPIIQPSNFYQLGNEYLKIVKIDTQLISVSPGLSGANVVWDFSELDFEHPSVYVDTVSCILPDNTPFFNHPSTNYDTSNFCLKTDSRTFLPSDNLYSYYLIQNDSLQFIGEWADNGGAEIWYYSFSDLRTDLIFPFTYNDIHLDSFRSSYLDFSGSGFHYNYGRIEVEADGYGTLITYEDTIPNALRVKDVLYSIDSSYHFGITYSTRTIYSWYSENREGPILQIVMDTYLPNSIGNAVYFKSLEQPTVITELPDRIPLSVYPNPASNSFVIKFDQPVSHDNILSIYSASGKLIMRRKNSASSNFIIEHEHLTPGLYFIELSNSKTLLGTSKLVIH